MRLIVTMLAIAPALNGALASPPDVAAPSVPPIIVYPLPPRPVPPPPPPPPALSATGAWRADAADGLCAVRRPYGAATLSIMPWPRFGPDTGMQRTELSVETVDTAATAVGGYPGLVTDAGGPAARRLGARGLMLDAHRFAAGTLVIDGMTRPTRGIVSTGLRPGATGVRVTTLDIAAVFAPGDPGETLWIRTDAVALPAFALSGKAQAAAQLTACQDAQMASWGITADERARIAVAAQAKGGDIATWFSSKRYPKAALRAGEQGEVIFRWAIGTDRRTKDCAIVRSSGSAALDAATCEVVLKGRYARAAVDAGGRPIVSHGLRRIVWRLPD